MTHAIFEGIQRGHGLSSKALQLMRMIERLRNPLDYLGTRPALAKPAAADLAEIEMRLEGLASRLSGAPTKHLDGEEAWKSLAFAVAAMMRERPSLLVPAADLKELVVRYCPPQDRSSWQLRSAQSIWGLLEHDGAERIIVNAQVRSSELRRLIQEDAGILFWSEEYDRCVRLVNSHWLDSHADAFRWIVEPWPGGRRCRFCAMLESPGVNALLPVELERRRGRTVIDGMVVLDAGATALTHDRCRPFWLQALAAASKYRSLEEARAADKAAGRASKFDSVQTSARALKARAHE